MKFGPAMQAAIQTGARICRPDWDGSFVTYINGVSLAAHTVGDRMRRIVPPGPLQILPYFARFTPKTSKQTTNAWQPGWMPSTEDTLAEDWVVMEWAKEEDL